MLQIELTMTRLLLAGIPKVSRIVIRLSKVELGLILLCCGSSFSVSCRKWLFPLSGRHLRATTRANSVFDTACRERYPLISQLIQENRIPEFDALCKQIHHWLGRSDAPGDRPD